jgi:hypothetical protein
MDYVPRSGWGARAYRMPAGATLYSRARRGVKIHYLGTPYTPGPHGGCPAYVRQLQASHMDGNGWSDIGYSFAVCSHGTVYEGRGLARRNSANGSTALNEQDYAVCGLLGTNGKASDALLHGLRDAIDHCRAKGPAGDWVGGHRDGYATACPGDELYAWVQRGAPRPGGRVHTVVRGETLSSIAGRYPGVSWQEIAAANLAVLPDPHLLAPGMRLTIPPPGGSSVPSQPAPPSSEREAVMQLSDQVALKDWVLRQWPGDQGLANGSIRVNTALGSGYAYSRIAAETARRIEAAVEAQGATIRELVAALAARDQHVDVDTLVERIETAIRNVRVRLEVED